MASQHLTLTLTSDELKSKNQFAYKDSSHVTASHQVGDSLDKNDQMSDDCHLSSNWDSVHASDSLLESLHRDDGNIIYWYFIMMDVYSRELIFKSYASLRPIVKS